LNKKASTLLSYIKKEYGKKIREHYMNNHTTPFEALVSCIISQRTKDEVTEKASIKLFSKANNPQAMSRLSKKQIADRIYPAGFYNQKAARIKELSQILTEKGGVPHTREGLMKLPAVGPKTADVVLTAAYGQPVIAIDVHVDVIAKRLGLVPENAGYEKTRATLESQFPKEDRHLINVGLVIHGREICKTRRPLCEKCGLKTVCDYYKKREERSKRSD